MSHYRFHGHASNLPKEPLKGGVSLSGSKLTTTQNLTQKVLSLKLTATALENSCLEDMFFSVWGPAYFFQGRQGLNAGFLKR